MGNINVNLENLSKEEREQLLKLVEKGNKKENSKVWIPKDGDTVYFITLYGSVGSVSYSESHLKGYKSRQIYPTKEACEFAIEKGKVEKELQDYALEYNEEVDCTDKTKTKWEIFYSHYENKLDVAEWKIAQNQSIRFSHYMIAINAIKTIGKDRIKKYYFEVEE